MTQFETEALLGITIPQRQLRDARNEIEESLGSVEVSLDGGQVQGGGGDRGTAGLVGGAKALDELGDQTEYLEDIYDTLDKMGASGGLGGGGGGAGGGAGGGGLFGTIRDYLAIRGGLSALGGGGGGILSRVLGFKGLSLAGATGTALTMPGILGQTTQIAPTEEGEREKIRQAQESWGKSISELFATGEGMFAGDRDINDLLSRGLGETFGENQNIERPQWLEELLNPPWAQNQPSWIDTLSSTLTGGGSESSGQMTTTQAMGYPDYAEETNTAEMMAYPDYKEETNTPSMMAYPDYDGQSSSGSTNRARQRSGGNAQFDIGPFELSLSDGQIERAVNRAFQNKLPEIRRQIERDISQGVGR